jgi:hypothetical protein
MLIQMIGAPVRLFKGARSDVLGDRQPTRALHVLHSDDKKRADLNCISHILSLIPHKRGRRKKIKLPKRFNERK